MAEGDYSFKAIINADTTSFQRNIKQAQSSVSSLSGTFGNLSKVISKALSFAGITASVGAIVKFGKESVKSAQEANKAFNVLNNTIRVTGATAWTTTDDIVQMSKELADSSNYTISEIQDMQSVLLGFRNITGETFEEASKAIMDMATVMGMDLKSATQTVGKALDDPIKGLDSLRRQGFQFTDEQKAELTQLIKNGKQLEAQKIILDELATTYGGASKAGQSSFARIRNATIELKETLGNKLLPIINEVLSSSTNTIKQLTSEIQKIDFSRIFGMIKNISNMIKPVFESIVNYFRDFGNEVSSLFNSDTLKPFLSILDTILGVLKSVFNEIKSNFERVKEMFSNMKEGLGGLADGKALQNISNVINKIIDVIWFLREQINSVVEDIKTLIFDRIKNIWNYFKQLFNNSNKALEESENGFSSWAEFLWSQFDQVFMYIQDLVNGVKAILNGDWAVAWEYAKLSVMRVCKIILDSVSQIANAFPDLINKMLEGINWFIEEINKFRAWLKQEPFDLLNVFESVDLTESSGLGKAINEAEKRIEELTGKTADVSIRHLAGVSQASKGTTQSIIDDITDVTDTYVSNAQKQHAVTEGINDYNEKSYQMYSEWDSKLLQQRQGNLEEWQREYHEINLKLIEEERKKALESDKTGADTQKINKYYDKMILNEKKRYLTAIFEATKKVIKKIIEVWKSLVTAIKKVFSTIVNAVKSAWNVLLNLFDFNIDEALEKILEFEDKVLSFFLETLPKMPAFVKSVLESIAVLFKNLTQTIDRDSLSTLIQEMISSLMTSLPGLLRDLIKIGSGIVIGLVDGISNSMPDIFNALYEIKDIVVETLRNIIPLINKLLTDSLPLITDIFFKIVNTVFENFPKVIDDLISILPKLVEAVVNNLPRLFEESLPKLVNGIVDLIPTIFSTSGQLIKGIIQAVPTIISALIRGIVDMLENLNSDKISQIISAIISMVGDISRGIIQSIGSIITELIPALIKLVVGLIEKIPDILSGLVTGTVEGFGKLGNDIVKGVKSAGSSVGNFFTDLFTGKLFADGTNSAPKGLAIVGEAGPELVNFHGGEKVYNNTNTEKMIAGAGASKVFNVNFYETKDTTAYAMMNQLRQWERNLAFNGVL